MRSKNTTNKLLSFFSPVQRVVMYTRFGFLSRPSHWKLRNYSVKVPLCSLQLSYTSQTGATLRLKNGAITLFVDPDPMAHDVMALTTPSGATSSVIKRQTFDLDHGDVFEINGFTIKFEVVKDKER